MLELARLVVRGEKAADRAWPGVWPPGSSFIVDVAAAGQLLFVNIDSALPGTTLIASRDLPPELRGRIRLARRQPDDPIFEGWPSHLSVLRFHHPTIRIDWLPGRTWPTPYRDSVLGALYRDAFHHRRVLIPQSDVPYPRLITRGYGCPRAEARSCAAVVLLERRILRSALGAPRTQMLELLRDYTAIRWARLANTINQQREVIGESRAGTFRATERRMLAGVAEHDTADMGQRVQRMLADQEAEILSDRAIHVNGLAAFRLLEASADAITILLGRLGVDWRPRVRQGYSLFEVLATAIDFDAFAAPLLARQAADRHGFDEILASISPSEFDNNPQIPRDDDHELSYYKDALIAAHGDPLPLVVHVPVAWLADPARFQMTLEPGARGMLTTQVGNRIAPRAAGFRFQMQGIDIKLRNQSVVIHRRPFPGEHMEIILLLPDSIVRRLQPKDMGTAGDSALRIAGEDIDMNIASGMKVSWIGGTISVFPDLRSR